MQCTCVVCAALQYISTLSHKQHNFQGKKVLNNKCGLLFFLQLLSETCLILRGIEQDMNLKCILDCCM